MMGRDSIRSQTVRLRAWVEVTHETKSAVKAAISPEDLEAVGCNNPDVHVVSKKDDRIVLTTPATLRKTTGKSKKHITSIQARDLFGEEWADHLPVLKFQRVGILANELDRDMLEELMHADAYVTFLGTGVKHVVIHAD
jgi:hypothetical protein